jgi:hypothetical protein
MWFLAWIGAWVLHLLASVFNTGTRVGANVSAVVEIGGVALFIWGIVLLVRRFKKKTDSKEVQ